MNKGLVLTVVVITFAALVLAHELYQSKAALSDSSKEITMLQKKVSGYRGEIKRLDSTLQEGAEAIEELQGKLSELAATRERRDREKIEKKVPPSPKVEKAKDEAGEAKPIRTGKEYIISTGDVLSISVWENPDLDRQVVVRPDGKISLPLIDEVKAEGLTFSELDKLITEKLKDFVRYADVCVSLTETRVRKITVKKITILGEVRSPGVYPLEGGRTVLEAIALAGGATKDAVLKSVVVVKQDEHKRVASRVDIARALKRGKMEEDVVLASRDIVYVPRRFVADLNHFLNQVFGPITKGVYVRDHVAE